MRYSYHLPVFRRAIIQLFTVLISLFVMSAARSADTLSDDLPLAKTAAEINALSVNGLSATKLLTLKGSDLPWVNTGLLLEKGQHITFLLQGAFHYGEGIIVEPGLAFWAGFGEKKPMFIPGQNTYTVPVPKSGPLYIARSLVEWKSKNGELTTPFEHYQMVQGQSQVLMLVWERKPRNGLLQLIDKGISHPLILTEVQRLKSPVQLTNGWYSMWLFGDNEIFQLHDHHHHTELSVYTHKDVGILQKDVDVPLRKGTSVSWEWIVNELPSQKHEDTPFTHDYLSIAFEFDDGQDLTYMWSAGITKETHFRCPLPRWSAIETHLVVRNDKNLLGQWLREKRDIFTDYHNAIGGSAKRITRVWIIANSVFQQGFGEASFKQIKIERGKKEVVVL